MWHNLDLDRYSNAVILEQNERWGGVVFYLLIGGLEWLLLKVLLVDVDMMSGVPVFNCLGEV